MGSISEYTRHSATSLWALIPKSVTCVVMALAAQVQGFGAEPPGANGRTVGFVITKGESSAVCVAYAQVLKTSRAEADPHCGRPETGAGNGFATPARRQLTPEELYAIHEQLVGLTVLGDVEGYDKLRRLRLGRCDDPRAVAACKQVQEEKAKVEARGERWGEPVSLGTLREGHTRAWRYDPEIDLDNDGKPDAVILYRGGRCDPFNNDERRKTSAFYPFAMAAGYSAVDVDKTKTFFGHPEPNWPVAGTKKLRFIGNSVGVFSYRGEFYFDTFFTNFSDFDNARISDRSLIDTLGVFLRKSGRTRQICEYKYQRP